MSRTWDLKQQFKCGTIPSLEFYIHFETKVQRNVFESWKSWRSHCSLMLENTLPENCILQSRHLVSDECRRALPFGEILRCDSEGYRLRKGHSYKEASSLYAMRKAATAAIVIKKDIAYSFGKYPIKVISQLMLSLICFWFQCNVQAVHTTEPKNWDRAAEAEHVHREQYLKTAEF